MAKLRAASQRSGQLRQAILLIAALSVVGMVGCAPTAVDGSSLKIGLLPIPESLPFYVAEAEGYFQAADVRVELVPFASAVERDAALQTGQIDGELNDPISALLLGQDGDTVRIVKVAYKATSQRAMIAILAGPGSAVRSPADLTTFEVAISRNSVIEYVTDRLLAERGIDPESIRKTEISKIPVREEMLIAGQVAAASLPDPFAFLAEKQGARVIANDGAAGIGQSVVTIRKEALDEKGAAVKKLLAAHTRAVETINANPENYRPLLVEKAKVPEPIADSFPVPSFPSPAVPNEAEMEDAIKWMLTRGLLKQSIAYEYVVDASYLEP